MLLRDGAEPRFADDMLGRSGELMCVRMRRCREDTRKDVRNRYFHSTYLMFMQGKYTKTCVDGETERG